MYMFIYTVVHESCEISHRKTVLNALLLTWPHFRFLITPEKTQRHRRYTSLINSEPANASFNVNSVDNTSSSDFSSKSVTIIFLPRHRRARNLQMTITFYNLHVIDSLHDDQKVEVPLSVCCPNVKSLRNKAIPVADYVVSQGFDVLAITEMWLGTRLMKFL